MKSLRDLNHQQSPGLNDLSDLSPGNNPDMSEICEWKEEPEKNSDGGHCFDSGNEESLKIFTVQELDGNTKLFVGNVSFVAKWYDLKQFFSKFGKVLHVYMGENHFTHKPTGIAFVTFAKVEDAVKALNADSKELFFQERILRLFPAEKKKRDIIAGESKPETMEVTYQPDVNTFIDILNDDALMLVFSYLDIKERIIVERVCKRWRSLSLRAWSSVSSLCFKNIFTQIGSVRDHELKRVLVRCSPTALRSVDITRLSASPFTDFAVDLVANHCPELRELNISGSPAINKTIKTLSEKCPKLQKIIMTKCYDIGEKGLWWLFKNCQNLETIHLEESIKVSGQCFHMLGPKLKTIILNECQSLQDVGIKKLAERCQDIESLGLSSCSSLTDQALSSLGSGLVNIRKLYICGVYRRVTSSGFRALSKLKNLEELYMTHNSLIDDKVLEAVSRGCPLLRLINLMGAGRNITDIGVTCLADCPLLEDLNISYQHNVTDASVEAVALNGKLKSVVMRSCNNVTHLGIMALVMECTELSKLDVSGCYMLGEDTLTEVLAKTWNAGRPKLTFMVGGTDMEETDLPVHDNIELVKHDWSRSSMYPVPGGNIEFSINGWDDDEDDDEDVVHLVPAGYEPGGYDAFSDEEFFDEDFEDFDDPLYAERFNLS